jgi:hypothetical protein
MKLLLLTSIASFVLLFQAPANPLQPQRPQGSIEGTVTRLGSNQPVSNARITVSPRGAGAVAARGANPPAPTKPVFTDGNGKFALAGLDEGNYNVMFEANGYVGQRYGRLESAGTPVTVTGGQATRDINVALTPAANIGGRVHDTSNQPLISVPVQLLEYTLDGYGRKVYRTVGTTRTNDRGEYRMYWVTPGRYYLRAGDYSTGGSPRFFSFAPNNVGANASEVPSVAGYAFYPAATEIGTARTIDLQAGADLRAVDLAVNTWSRTFSIRGKLIDSRTGKAPAAANVFAEPLQVGLGPVTSVTNAVSPAYDPATGTFDIRNLLPATYSVVAMLQVPSRDPREPPAPAAIDTVTVTLGNSDVDGVTLAPVPGATIVGRVSFEGEIPPAAFENRPMVLLTAIGGNGGFDRDQAVGPLDANGNFRVTNMGPGDYQFELVNFPDGIGFFKEARLDGSDALGVPLRVSGSRDKQLDLVFRAGGGRVVGTVTDVRSQPVPGAVVVLIPDRARFRADLYQLAAAGQNGGFRLLRIPPGDYRVFSWESIEENAWLDPEVLARFEGRGTRVHVTESSDETINVQIIPAESSK